MITLSVRVFEIIFDHDRFQSLLVADAENVQTVYPITVESFTGQPRTIERKTYDFGWGKPMPEDWAPVPLKPKNLDRLVPDLWSVEKDILAVTNGRYPLLERHFEMSGQVLNAQCDIFGQSVNLKLLNPLVVDNCLDHEACNWREDDDGAYENLDLSADRNIVFNPDRLDAFPIFRVPEAMSMLLCTERYGSPEEEFKAAVEQNGLTGLIFNLLWEEA